LTPPLCAMMTDDLLKRRMEAHLVRLSELVDKELDRTRFDGHLHYLARHYREETDRALGTWRRLGGGVLEAFREHEPRATLEIMPCPPPRGYLPLRAMHPKAVGAQIRVAVADSPRQFGRPPRGIWLPECAYYPGLDEMLRDAELRYFV